jgi:hypothetical protein
MATQSAQDYKAVTVAMLNYMKPGNAFSKHDDLSPADLTLTNLEVMRWFYMKTWGNPDPAPDHAYVPQARSNSILYWKKCISFFTPKKMQPWDPLAHTGNPTKCNET